MRVIRLSGYVPDKDIELQFTGVRPGEKMSEELVGEGEHATPSQLDKVFLVQTASHQNLSGLYDSVARLEALAFEGRSDEVLRELRTLMSESRPAKAISHG